MTQSGSVGLLLVLALVAANLPFANQRWFAIGPRSTGKRVVHRLLELVLLYFVVGGIGLLLEARVGQLAPQGWEFYAITVALFITFAFPGYVWCFLLRRQR
jgi:hypothetical protein